MGGLEYALSGIFGQTVGRYGPGLAIVALLAFCIIGLAAYFLKTKIDLMRQGVLTADAERARDHAEKVQERSYLLKQVDEAQAQTHTFMTNHLEHDRAEREALAKVLTETSCTLKAIADDLAGHRHEESERTGKVLAKLDEMHLDFAKGAKA